ncbi:MAG: NYN domain-containing protein [Anaerolineae bacterium]|jgi:hypothetical protein
MAKEDIAVVDGSNVAYAELSQQGEPKVSNLVAVGRALEAQGYRPIVIVDATLRHEVDDPEQLEGLLDKQEVRQAPAGTDADFFVLETAEQHHGLLVSNDEFEQFREEYPWITERRLPFMIVEGRAELYKPKLARDGRD